MCLHPYIKMNDGAPMLLPCGKCLECRQRYSRDWQFRLKQEMNRCPNYWWITLTYNDWNLPVSILDGKRVSNVKKCEVQNFLKRLRQLLGFPEFRYFAVGEYGKNNRAHYHLLVFGNMWRNVHQAYIDCFRSWAPNGNSKGFVYVKRGEISKIHYVTKYVNKLDLRHHNAPPFKLMSKSIGLSFLTPSMIEYYYHKKDRLVHDGEYTRLLPRYYVKKLDELFPNMFHAGLRWSETCQKPVHFKSNDPRWYHDYFTKHHEEIREQFIDAELNNGYITKFLDPDINMVFDYYLHKCKVTRDAIFQGEEVINEVCMKEKCLDLEMDIGPDIYYWYGVP